MADYLSNDDRRDIVLRQREIVPRLDRQLGQPRTIYRRYSPAHSSYDTQDSQWTSYAAQRHIRSIAVEQASADGNSRVWMATWGGVLSWEPDSERCTRHTSQHGLPGNAIQTITIDSAGHIWAAGHRGGLACLDAASSEPWTPQNQPGLAGWRVVQMAPRPEGGVVLVLQNAEGRAVLAAVPAANAAPHQLADSGLALKDVQALWVEPGGEIWIGNAWGLHRFRENEGMYTFDLKGEAAYHLAKAPGEGFWLSNPHGLFRFRPDKEPMLTQAARQELISLAVSPEDGRLWAASYQEAGFLDEDHWSPAPNPPETRLTCLALAPSGGTTQAWIGSVEGLYRLTPFGCRPALSWDDEDYLSNAIHSLWASPKGLWAGASRGVNYWNGQTWKTAGPASAGVCLSDVHAIAASPAEMRLVFAGWRGGPGYFEDGEFVPGCDIAEPLVGLAAGEDNSLWAAAPDNLYSYSPLDHQWKPVHPPARLHLGGRFIQAICSQPAHHPEAGSPACLWVGTSAGLLRYRPELELWDSPSQFAPAGLAAELEALPVQALHFGQHANRLWIGTPSGLFGSNPWQQVNTSDVHALVEEPPSQPDTQARLWIGTSSGLEVDGKRFTTQDSGLADDLVSTLAVRVVDGIREIWIGSPAGLSCYLIKA